MRIERAVIGQRRKSQRLDAAVLVGREFANAVVVARKAGRRDVLDARLDPLDRHARDDGRDDRDHVPRIHRHLVAEAAADVAADDADLALGQAREHRNDGTQQVRYLRRDVNRQLAGDLVERGDAAAGLHRAGVHPGVEDFLAHRHGGAGEGRIGRGLVARFPGEDVVRMGALAMADFVLAGDVFADDRRVLGHRLVRVDDRLQLFVFHFHRVGAVRRAVAVAGDDERHFLHLEVHLLVGEHGLHVAAHRRHPVELDRLQVIGGQDRHHARHGEGLGLVDGLDARMGVRAAHDGPVQHARQLDVIDVGSLAADEAGVLLAQSGGAQSLKLLLALERVGCSSHGEISRSGGLGQALADESFFAAYCTALTMFW